ncbi:hypothetical protein D9619_010169 [Psilocybe cf. subviscida]|uniref:Uncharacterized protein n=1 Tax=Psilocybe cf. subviscida TaxID=2480587 RepID=A0A8H5ATN7_9AGAR|nr:hypothetical protein D9619_010169 [Psilocybe cf. subviscida]
MAAPMDTGLILPFEFSKMRLPSTTERPVTDWSRYVTGSLILNTQTGEDWGLILSLLDAAVRVPFTSRMPMSMDLPLAQLRRQYGSQMFETVALRRLQSICGYEQLKKAVFDETVRAARGHEFRILDVVKSFEPDDLHSGALHIRSITVEQSDLEIHLPTGHTFSSAQRRLTKGSCQRTLSWWFVENTLSPICDRRKISAEVISEADGFSPARLGDACKDAEEIFYECGQMEGLQGLPLYFGLPKWPKVEDEDVRDE